MNLKPGWLLLLLSVSAGVWSVPIDRNGGNQETKEEVPEESVVIHFFPVIILYVFMRFGQDSVCCD